MGTQRVGWMRNLHPRPRRLLACALFGITVAACGGSDDPDANTKPTPACEECAVEKYSCQGNGGGESIPMTVVDQRKDGCSLVYGNTVYELSCDPLRVCQLTKCADAMTGSSLTWSFPPATFVCTPSLSKPP